MILGNSKLVKEINTNLVLNIIRDNEPVSRAELVKITNLAFPTVIRIVESLISINLVYEVGKGESDLGRKPILLKVNSKAFYVVGLELTNHIKVSVMDIKGNKVFDLKLPLVMEEVLNRSHIDKALDAIAMAVDYVKDSGIEILGIGVAIPGRDFKHNEKIKENKFESWNVGFDIEGVIEKRFGIKVYSENIARSYTYGELIFGYGRYLKNFVYIMIDYGVGIGIVVNNEIYKGRDGVAGEFGHISFDLLNGRQCYCGNKGCVETYISEYAIISSVKNEIKNGRKTKITDYCKADISKINLKMVFKAYKEKDELATEIVSDVIFYLGNFIASVVNIFNPEAVIIGGSVAIEVNKCVEISNKMIEQNVFINKVRDTQILVSNLIGKKDSIGVAAQVISQIFS